MLYKIILSGTKTSGRRRIIARSRKITILKFFLIGFGAITILIIGLVIWVYVSLFAGPGALELSDYHPFRSPEAKEKYLRHYDKRAQLWPVSSEIRIVETSYGQTFVRISGRPDAPPLVLLPGGGSNSLIWRPIIKTLSEGYRTYAVDNIYDFGRSVYTRSMTTTDDLLMWLDELFDVLELGDNINLMGLSYGGWLTSQYTLHAPARVRKVVLLAPASTVLPLSQDFIKRMIISIIPHRYFLKTAVYWSLEDAVSKNSTCKKFVDEHVEDTYLGLQCFKFKQPPRPTVLRDDEMRSIKKPMLFLVGENEKIYSAHQAVQRLSNVAPQIETEIIPDCGHDLWIVQKELVTRRVLEFLKSQD